jgi:hypothetical protein
MQQTLALMLGENGTEDPAKPWISNRQHSGDSGTLLSQYNSTLS